MGFATSWLAEDNRTAIVVLETERGSYGYRFPATLAGYGRALNVASWQAVNPDVPISWDDFDTIVAAGRILIHTSRSARGIL